MNTSPVDGSNIAAVSRSDAKDIDFALDAAHRAADAWGKTSVSTAPICCCRSPTVLRRTWNIWRWRRAGITVNRSAKR
jgi:hypothetical protein